MKLFKEWFTQWTPDVRDSFLEKITGMDESFGEKLKAELQNGIVNNHSEFNGEEVLED